MAIRTFCFRRTLCFRRLRAPPIVERTGGRLLLLFLYGLTAGPVLDPTFGFQRACFSGPSLNPLYARARCIQYIPLLSVSRIYTTRIIILGPFGFCITCTNRHLLCVYYFTSYTYYIYIVALIQQGAHIIDLLNILLLGHYCVSHIRITWLY